MAPIEKKIINCYTAFYTEHSQVQIKTVIGMTPIEKKRIITTSNYYTI